MSNQNQLKLFNLSEYTPNFKPASEHEQGRLDKIKMKELNCNCPNCGHEFIQEY